MDSQIERAIAERARSQLGLVTTPQVLALGMARSTFHRRVAAGLWVPVGRRTFRLAGAPPGREVDALAVCLDLGAVASHRTASWLHDLMPWPGVIDVTVPKGRTVVGLHDPSGVRIHTSTNLPGEDITHVRAIRVVSVARALMGLAALDGSEVPHRELVAVVELAVQRRQASDRWLWWLLERRRCRGRNGVTRFEDVLAERARLGPTESWLERALLGLIADAGLPVPIVQRRIGRRGRFVARVDMAYEAGKIVLEALGYASHATREQQNRDAARASELQLLGWDVYQLTYDQIVRTPAWAAHVVRAALTRGGLLADAA